MAKFRDTVKPLLFIGYLVGSLPHPSFVLEFFGNRFSKARLAKIAVTYSVLLYSILITLSAECSVAFGRSIGINLKGVNLIAFRIYINFNIHYVVITFVLGIINAGRISRLVKSIAKYDDQFRHVNLTSIVTPGFITLLLVSVFVVLLEMYRTHSALLLNWDRNTPPCLAMSLLPQLDFSLRLILTVVIPHVVFKAGVFIILASIGVLADAVSDRVASVARDVETRLQMLVESSGREVYTVAAGSLRNNNGYIDETEAGRVICDCSLRVAKLKSLEKHLGQCAGPILMVVLPMKIVELVTAVYLAAVVFFSKLENSPETLALTIPTTAACVVLFFLSESGERLLDAVSNT